MKVTGHDFQRRTEMHDVGTRQLISFYTSQINVSDEFFSKDIPEVLQVEIKPIPKRRSLDANAYFWKLADELAKKLRITAVEVYKELIHRVGVFDYVLVYEEAKDHFIKNWESKGTGWIVEEEPSKINGAVKLKVYQGSSQYTSAEMSRLIDELITECQEHGIETLTPDEKEELIQRWNIQSK